MSGEALDRLSDEDLMRRISETSCELCFEVLYERYSIRAIAFARRVIGNEEGAEDAMQEAFFSILRSAHTFDPERRFTPWFFTVLHHACLAELKKRNVSVTLDDVGEPVFEEDLTVEPDERDALRKALETLAPPHREAIALRFYENRPYEDIAAITGAPAGTLRSRVHHALRRLARMLGMGQGEADNSDASEAPIPANSRGESGEF